MVTRANESVEGNHIRCAHYSTAIVLAFLHPNIPLGDCLVQVAKILCCFDLGSCFREDKEQAVLVGNPLSVLFETWIVFPSPSLYLSLIFQQGSPSTSEDILGGPTMISGAKTFKFRGGGGRGRRPWPPQGELPPSHGRKKEEGTLTEQIRAR